MSSSYSKYLQLPTSDECKNGIVECKFRQAPNYAPILIMLGLMVVLLIILPRVLSFLNFLFFEKIYKDKTLWMVCCPRRKKHNQGYLTNRREKIIFKTQQNKNVIKNGSIFYSNIHRSNLLARVQPGKFNQVSPILYTDSDLPAENTLMLSETLSNYRTGLKHKFDPLQEKGEQKKKQKSPQPKNNPSSNNSLYLVPGISQAVLQSEKKLQSITHNFNSIQSTKRVQFNVDTVPTKARRMSLFPPTLQFAMASGVKAEKSTRSEKKSVTLAIPTFDMNRKTPSRLESPNLEKTKKRAFEKRLLMPSLRPESREEEKTPRTPMKGLEDFDPGKSNRRKSIFNSNTSPRVQNQTDNTTTENHIMEQILSFNQVY